MLVKIEKNRKINKKYNNNSLGGWFFYRVKHTQCFAVRQSESHAVGHKRIMFDFNGNLIPSHVQSALDFDTFVDGYEFNGCEYFQMHYELVHFHYQSHRKAQNLDFA